MWYHVSIMNARTEARYATIVIDFDKVPRARRTGGIVTRFQAPRKGVFVRKPKHRHRDLA